MCVKEMPNRGLIGILCCCIAAPFAIVWGKQAMDEIDASGGMLQGRGEAKAGFILGIVALPLYVVAFGLQIALAGV